VYQIAKSGDVLSRVEIGRSKFRHAASPSYIPCLTLSLKYIFVLETPLFFNMKAMLGLDTYDSDDDAYDPDARNYYCMRWAPEVRCVLA